MESLSSFTGPAGWVVAALVTALGALWKSKESGQADHVKALQEANRELREALEEANQRHQQMLFELAKTRSNGRGGSQGNSTQS